MPAPMLELLSSMKLMEALRCPDGHTLEEAIIFVWGITVWGIVFRIFDMGRGCVSMAHLTFRGEVQGETEVQVS